MHDALLLLSIWPRLGRRPVMSTRISTSSVGILAWLAIACSGVISGCAILPVPEGEKVGVFQLFEPKIRLQDTGVGFAGYWLGKGQPGVFLHLQTSFSGAVSGVRYGDLPVEAMGDPVTDREHHGATLAAGPTWKVNDQLSIYGGIGIGAVSRWEERFDADLVLSPTGYYHHDLGTDTGFHAVFGSLFQLGGGWVLDAGYGTYSESVHVGIGFSY
jgi:hypothetical protein